MSVSGVMGTNSDGERQIAAYGADSVGSGSVIALGMRNASIGGEAFGGQTGVWQGSGLNNIGILVRAWGKVLSVNPATNTFLIDDGAGIGVKCILPSSMPVSESWMTVGVTGISSCEKSGAVTNRVVRVSQPVEVSVP